ncbi:MAG TPA: hypothetical protein PKO33_03445, partial [Pyrinomonadaceae bacterium]|nr:hypothetical protein [Pyrinomonadaceae bacterium]
FRQYAPLIDFDYVLVNNRAISDVQMQRYSEEGANQIGVHGSISPETIEGAEVVYGNLLDEGEMVRHHPEKLAQVVLLCALQPRRKVVL